MKLIKLNAIDSTNSFLKDLERSNEAENFTVVIAKQQTNGKGQMGAKWEVENDKNLTFSILCLDYLKYLDAIFDLNVLVSVAVFEVLFELNIPKLAIKWPNDIMADNKKIGGILIENSFKSVTNVNSIIGIGINVNQENFDGLQNASSIVNVIRKEINVEQLGIDIANRIELFTKENQSDFYWKTYQENLFKKGLPMVFETPDSKKLMGIIEEVTTDGKLKVLHENNLVKLYATKEIKMIY
jgi:BirA family biotin operon repressor/biotin-[acetyl-CoA-carboxylase] ligase